MGNPILFTCILVVNSDGGIIIQSSYDEALDSAIVVEDLLILGIGEIIDMGYSVGFYFGFDIKRLRVDLMVTHFILMCLGLNLE